MAAIPINNDKLKEGGLLPSFGVRTPQSGTPSPGFESVNSCIVGDQSVVPRRENKDLSIDVFPN